MDTSSFSVPPLDGSLAVIQIYDFHLRNSANCPLFVYTTSDGSKKILTWSAFVQAIHGSAKAVLEQLGKPSDTHKTVAMLAVGDSLSYITQLFGIMRAGFVAFPISTRNSADSVVHLLKITGAQHVYVSADPAMQSLASDAINRSSSTGLIQTHSTLAFEDLYDSTHPQVQSRNAVLLPEFVIGNMKEPCVILHSSGTTSFPKAIVYNHSDLLQFAALRLTGEMGKPGQIHAMHHVPMFHAMGITSLARAASAAMVIAVFEPQSPPTLPTPERLIRMIKEDGCHIAPCVPMFLESWATDSEAVKILVGLRALIFAGGPLSQATGDFLIRQGVQLHAVYGGTEVDISLGEDWQYFVFADYFKPHLAVWDEARRVYELWAMENKASTYCPVVINDIIEGECGYATKDLIVQHPTKPNLWRVYGRNDDQIMLSTGEKVFYHPTYPPVRFSSLQTNPGPIESIFTEDPRILGAVMFGRGRFNNGIILLPSSSNAMDPKNRAAIESFKDSIAELVDAANAFAPAHSKIYREMILIADPVKEFEITLKGTPRRHSIIVAHSAEIEKAYEDFSESTAGIDPGSLSWDYASLLECILKLLESVFGRKVPPEVDVFNNGLDSLHAVRLRNIIFNVVSQRFGKDIASRAIPLTLVYQYPTAEKLAGYLSAIQRPQPHHELPRQLLSTLQVMNDLVNDLTAGLETASDRILAGCEEETILLTGSTGSLGCLILEKLCRRSDVVKIYALNRSGRMDLKARQQSALREDGLDPGILDCKPVELVTVDLTAPKFGIGDDLYDKMLSSVTLIIHTAWPVQFNYGLESFLPALRSVRNLVDFSKQCPSKPRFIYTSSIAVVSQWKDRQNVPAEATPDPSVAGSFAYGQAKWISERILDKATQLGIVQATSIRIGQLCGAPNGMWNAHEWFPSICQLAKSVASLPDTDMEVAWLPSDVAASFVLGVKDCSVPYLNLSHPTPFSLRHIFASMAKLLNLPLVPFEDWIQLISSSPNDLHLKTRTTMLLQFVGDVKELPTEPKLDLDVSLAKSPALRMAQASAVSDEDVKKWLKCWKLL
ncbi:hypothetical protein D9758_011283 [Tetrapyrgos nigripes]|uniref:Carrier domain-containing protein n=1 Tax=Tetrapyrgos nigripes TaxID=182062 RepID=A0A8H5FRX1_9AGAR|nr:hypothetical protein D9758_011283 [Tetrapyrgos nigripes]